jgi:hypothetical protein
LSCQYARNVATLTSGKPTSFDPYAHRAKGVSANSILYRKNEALPLGEDIRLIDSVRCPCCGNVEQSPALKLFGFIPAAKTTAVLVGVLVLTLVFGFWLLRS